MKQQVRMLRADDDEKENEDEGEPTITLDSGATRHMVLESSAEGVRDADITRERRTVLAGKKGVTFETSGHGRLRALDKIKFTSPEMTS